ncbi:MAG: hypothetical protein AAB675_02630 [Patescibacteria group bacterium]
MSKETSIQPQESTKSPNWSQIYDGLKRDYPRELKPLLEALGRWNEESRHSDIRC